MKFEIYQVEAEFPLQGYRKNVHSQCGEDGILEYLLDRIGSAHGYFVEFGAWDGKRFSNCARLAEQGWRGCFIEGSRERSKELERNYAGNTRVSCLNRYVGLTEGLTLDAILGEAGAPPDFDVLSIDIDGNDYQIWQSLEKYQPAICLIEFNPSIRVSIIYVQDYDQKLNQGCSLTALWLLAKSKGYGLVGATDWNAIFVRRSLIERFSLPEYEPDKVKDRRYETTIFQCFDGTIKIAGVSRLLWADVPFCDKEFQVLPKTLRFYTTSRSLRGLIRKLFRTVRRLTCQWERVPAMDGTLREGKQVEETQVARSGV